MGHRSRRRGVQIGRKRATLSRGVRTTRSDRKTLPSESKLYIFPERFRRRRRRRRNHVPGVARSFGRARKGLALITFPATAASLLDPRAATDRNAYDGSNTLNAVDVLIRGAAPKILTEEEAIERKHRHEEEKERARLSAIRGANEER